MKSMNPKKNYRWSVFILICMTAITIAAILTPGHHRVWYLIIPTESTFIVYYFYARKHRNIEQRRIDKLKGRNK